MALTKIVRVAEHDQDCDHDDRLQLGHLSLFSFVQLEEFSASALAHLIIMINKIMFIKSTIIKIMMIAMKYDHHGDYPHPGLFNKAAEAERGD